MELSGRALGAPEPVAGRGSLRRRNRGKQAILPASPGGVPVVHVSGNVEISNYGVSPEAYVQLRQEATEAVKK